jgi:hypothetical protein
VVETPVDLIAFLAFFLGCFLQFGRPYLQIPGSVGRVMPWLFCKMYLPPLCWIYRGPSRPLHLFKKKVLRFAFMMA